MARLHELIGQHLGQDADAEVVIGIESDHGPWLAALAAARYTVFAVNPLQASRYRERHGVSGAKSDAGDAHVLADMIRTNSHQLRAVAGDSADAEGIKVLARTHKTLIWERTRQVQRLRHQLLEYFPAALDAFDDLDTFDDLELLGKAPDPARAAKLTRAGQRGAQARPPAEHPGQGHRGPGRPASWPAGPAAGRHCHLRRHRPVPHRTDHRPERAGQNPAGQVKADFGRHPDAEIYRSQPGMGAILGARVLAEFGDAPDRYADGKGRRNYAATSPITRASGRKKVVAARFVHNDRLVDALNAQAFASLSLARRPRPLRPAPRPRHRAQRRPAPARQPSRRHPARMPQNPHSLRRGNRLVPPAKPPSI